MKININGLLGLNLEEIEIVYRRCKGETVENIAKAMDIGQSTIFNDRMPRILEMLEVEKWRDVDDELSVPLRKIILTVSALQEGWPEAFREKIEALRESKEVSEKLQPNTAPGSTTPTSTGSEQSSQPNQERRGPWILIAIPLLIFCLLGISALLLGWRFIQAGIGVNSNQATQTSVPSTENVLATEPSLTTQPPDTDTPLPTDTVALTETPFPTSTFTATMSPTMIPTKELYEQDDPAYLRPDIFLYMNPNFGPDNFALCYAPNPGFNLLLEYVNNSTEQFSLRFDKSQFHVFDDTGREYSVETSGNGRCDAEPGIKESTIPGGANGHIYIGVSGSIGLDVKYLILKVDNISGYGPFSFKKDI